MYIYRDVSGSVIREGDFPFKPSSRVSMEKMETNTQQPVRKEGKNTRIDLLCSQTTAETPLRCSSLINLICVVLLV